jgi:hypothetical protein
MDQSILSIAEQKLAELRGRFDGFVTVFLDDWRGYRFIYDVEASSCCTHGCPKCPLVRLLNFEQDGGIFSAALRCASDDDKKIFGPRKYLNWRSFAEYQDCYSNFLIQKCFTRKEINDELNLVRAMRVLYANTGSLRQLETKFKRGVISKALKRAKPKQKRFIRAYLVQNPDFFAE